MRLDEVLLLVVPAFSLIFAVLALDGRVFEQDRPLPWWARLLIALGALGVGWLSFSFGADMVRNV